MKFTPFLFAVVGGSVLLSQASFPDPDSTTELPPLEVVAYPTGANERSAASETHTYTAGEIAGDEFAQTLATIPGVHFDQPGGAGGRTTLYLRGAEENFALVFLDGVPLNDPTNSRGGAVDFSALEMASLRTFAVVQGAASVRYGPEALAGVVHLSTDEDAIDSFFRVRGDLGSSGLRRALVDTSTSLSPSGNARMGLFASATEDGEHRRGHHERRFLRTNFSTQGPFAIRFSVWHGELDAQSFPDDSGGYEFATIRLMERRESRQSGLRADLSCDLNSSRLVAHFDHGRFETSIESPGVAPGLRDPAGLPASSEDRAFERSRLQARWESLGERPFRWVVGLDDQREWGKSSGLLDFGVFVAPVEFAQERDRIGIFGETSFLLAKQVEATVGWRGDRYYNDHNTHSTLRAGLRGNLSPSLTWSLAGGNAYKKPSFYALAHPLVGNRDLLPEKGYNVNAGLRKEFESPNLTFEVDLFASRFRNGIDFDPGPPPQLVNRSKIRVHGVAIRAGWVPFPSLRLQSAVTWLEATAEPSGERLRGRPSWQAGSQLLWKPASKWEIRVQWRYTGEVADTSIPTGAVTLDHFHRFDVLGSWLANERFQCFIGLSNALNSTFHQAVGFPSKGRSFQVGVGAEF